MLMRDTRDKEIQSEEGGWRIQVDCGVERNGVGGQKMEVLA